MILLRLRVRMSIEVRIRKHGYAVREYAHVQNWLGEKYNPNKSVEQNPNPSPAVAHHQPSHMPSVSPGLVTPVSTFRSTRFPSTTQEDFCTIEIMPMFRVNIRRSLSMRCQDNMPPQPYTTSAMLLPLAAQRGQQLERASI